jgi:pimeloyl-ACP methyl ester carboxylesterase
VSTTDAPSTELHLESSGSGDPVVLLHSSGLSGRQWRRLATAFVERGHRAIVPDFTGQGASPSWPEPKPFSVREDVAHVTALLAGLPGGAPAHVVGHSYGAFVALLAALAVPSSVRSLTLFEPVAFGALDGARDAEARAELTKLETSWGSTDEAHERWLRSFVEYWGGEGAWSALREEARAEFRRVGWAVKEGVESLASDTTPASAYAVLRCPVTLVTGELTPLAARRVVEQLASTIPGARKVTIPGAGHMAPLSHAPQVNAVMLEAVAAVGPRGALHDRRG